jgi:hypothetical protein
MRMHARLACTYPIWKGENWTEESVVELVLCNPVGESYVEKNIDSLIAGSHYQQASINVHSEL